MLKTLVKFQTATSQRERGATAVEYGIMVAAIAAVVIVIVFAIGEQIQTAFNTVLNGLGGEVGGED